jgi:hypothetical protein
MSISEIRTVSVALLQQGAERIAEAPPETDLK